MKDLRFEDLYPPEYYHEIPDFDSRIAIRKFWDARDTMGYAKLSLSFIDSKEENDFEKNFVKTIHLRHAIQDLSNSFDLLLQIPWLYYRAWERFNIGGNLRTKELYNRKNTIRNNMDWVYNAEKECSAIKLIMFLNSINSPLKQKINDFKNNYLSNHNKVFTVRSLCNTLKHNHIIDFKELYDPYKFNVSINGEIVNLRERNLGFCYEQQFYNRKNPDEIIGIIKTNYSNDLEIDINYTNGDEFRFIDCTHQSDRYQILDILRECADYYDAIVDLFEDIYEEIYPKMIPCLSINDSDKPNIKNRNNNIDLNKYFTVC